MTVRDLWRSFPFLTRFLTAIGLGTGAIVGAAQAWPLVEPYIFAHRGYVLEKVIPVQNTVNEVLIWKAEDIKNKIKTDTNGWVIQLQKEQDGQTRSLIQRQIEQLNAEQAQIDERIKKLKGN